MAEKRAAGPVAHDDEIPTLRLGPSKEIDRAGIGDCVVHARAVDVTLNFSPGILLAGLPQVIAHTQLGLRKFGRNQIALQSHPVEKRVVADEGVVEIDPYSHHYRAVAGAERPLRPARTRAWTCP